MTIIVNGVDVTKCPYCVRMTKVRCGIPNLPMDKWLCEENPNCDFKGKERANKFFFSK